jgi:hypothetical protein
MRKPQPRKAAHRPGSLSPLLLLLLTLSSGPLLSAATPVGQWLFNANNPLAAEAGSALELTGQHALITGITPDDGAIRIGPGSHYSLNHGLPNSPGFALRNTYSLLIDFRIPQVGPWYCFFQTDPSNTSDGDCFIQANSGKIGVGQTGYSAATCPPNTWQRLLLTVDHSLGIYRLYLEGALILDAAPQAQDGRFSLSPELLLFADNDSEDNPIDVSQVAIYSTCLSETEAADLGGLSTTAGLATFITPPYLQDLRPDGLTIMWETDRPSTGRVEFWNEQESGLTTATPQPSGFGTTIHRCTITDLTPGTRYSYQSFLNDEPGPGGSFTTAPTTPVDFTFGVWSDSQGSNHNAYPPDPYAPTTAMMQHMVTNGVQFGVAVGDMAENGASYDDTRQFYLNRIPAGLGSDTPWFVAWGNHDSDANAVIRKFAHFPSYQRPGYTPGYGSYSFNYANCHFICLDYASANADLASWLETDLQSTANQNARFTFLFVHVPPYCELWIDGSSHYRNTLVPLMETYGVDACFSGHTHEYSRGYLNDIYYCITGGGSWLDIPESLVYDWPHMTVGGQHLIPGLTRSNPSQGGGLVNEYVRVEVQGDSFTASMVAFNPDGTEIGILDQFSLPRVQDPNPPSTPTLTGPATLDVFSVPQLTLHSTPYTDPDPADTHVQTRWRLSRSPNPLAASDVVLEQTTPPDTLTCSIPSDTLQPGQTLYAAVSHLNSRETTSPWSDPIAIAILPNPIYSENFDQTKEHELPAGWTASHNTSIDIDSHDPANPRSNTYLTWTVVSEQRLATFGANRVNTPEVINQQSLYAESDQRSGVQLQYIESPDYNLVGFTNVHLLFLSNYMQNQDSLGAVEYSTNAGTTWLPALYLLDEPDVRMLPDTITVDGTATFTTPGSDVPTANGLQASGGTYGEHIFARPYEALAPFVSPRTNDDATGSKQLERLKLSQADDQPAVRFRFTLVGTSSWFWGIDDFSLYGTPMAPATIQIASMQLRGGLISIHWTTSTSGSCQIQSCSDLADANWQDEGDPAPASQGEIQLAPTTTARFYRVLLTP